MHEEAYEYYKWTPGNMNRLRLCGQHKKGGRAPYFHARGFFDELQLVKTPESVSKNLT